MVYSLAILSFLALSLHQGDAIRCYVCSSSRDANCKDSFQSSHQEHKLTHCSQDNMRSHADIMPAGLFSSYGHNPAQPEDFVCVKAVTREHGREVVVRSCSVPRADTFDVCSQLKSRDLSFCETCDHDSCNGALSLVPESIMLALLPAALLAYLAAV